jgi:predicted nucleic acid-binding protein
MSLRLYLDTSVISLVDDDRSPERRDLTRELWNRFEQFNVSISETTRREIEDTLDSTRRASMLSRIVGFPVLAVTPEAQVLAQTYLDAAIFPRSMPDDALHVAIAVLARQDVLVSWNFKHLVNQRRRAAVDALNLRLGLPLIAILVPPEV